jgi:AcrR family transcriptional regulator
MMPSDLVDPETSKTNRGRLPAGQDPVKRDQILEGAQRCFLEMGYEAASMNEITAEAGVSKGTIYVYFQNKEELFSQLIDRKRGALTTLARAELESGTDVPDSLFRFGVAITESLTSAVVVKAQRMVLGVADRMPEIAERFFQADPFSAFVALHDYLLLRVEAGDLVIEDTELAARQFIELSMASFFKRRLFGNIKEEAPRAEIERVVASGVAMFMKFYGAPQKAD